MRSRLDPSAAAPPKRPLFGVSGFGGIGLLSVNGSKVTLLIRGYPKATGITFGTCEFDMANLPANDSDIGFTDSFSISME